MFKKAEKMSMLKRDMEAIQRPKLKFQRLKTAMSKIKNTLAIGLS